MQHVEGVTMSTHSDDKVLEVCVAFSYLESPYKGHYHGPSAYYYITIPEGMKILGYHLPKKLKDAVWIINQVLNYP